MMEPQDDDRRQQTTNNFRSGGGTVSKSPTASAVWPWFGPGRSLDRPSPNEQQRPLLAVLLPQYAYGDQLSSSAKRKRTCRVNLGGHCSTEKAISMADRWHFLNSGMSPGRRRR
jgi:hypothetical protein